MWSEADNYDLALSFQEKAGCDEIWEKICQVKSIHFSQFYALFLKQWFTGEYANRTGAGLLVVKF